MRTRTTRIHTDFFHSVSFVDISLGFPYEQLGFDIRKGMNIVDVGAHHGMYSIKAAQLGARKVLAIEAHPSNFRLLQKNIAENAIDNVIAINAAASNENGRTLMFESSHSGQHTIVPEMNQGHSQQTIEIQSYRLDTLLSSLKFDPDLMKIDCEGAELLVLKGAERLLSRPNSLKVVVEVHSDSTVEVETYLSGHGFEIKTLSFDKPFVFAKKLAFG